MIQKARENDKIEKYIVIPLWHSGLLGYLLGDTRFSLPKRESWLNASREGVPAKSLTPFVEKDKSEVWLWMARVYGCKRGTRKGSTSLSSSSASTTSSASSFLFHLFIYLSFFFYSFYPYRAHLDICFIFLSSCLIISLMKERACKSLSPRNRSTANWKIRSERSDYYSNIYISLYFLSLLILSSFQSCITPLSLLNEDRTC